MGFSFSYRLTEQIKSFYSFRGMHEKEKNKDYEFTGDWVVRVNSFTPNSVSNET